MIFIGGISQGEKILNYTQTVICDICGRYGRYQVIMTYMYFSFFFIPLFKWNKRFYVKMTCCGSVYELDPEVGRDILAGRQVEITRKDLTLCQRGNGSGAVSYTHLPHMEDEYQSWQMHLRLCGER